jgi:hypothetical protein
MPENAESSSEEERPCTRNNSKRFVMQLCYANGIPGGFHERNPFWWRKLHKMRMGGDSNPRFQQELLAAFAP